MVEATSGLTGTVQLTVTHKDGTDRHYAVAVARDETTITEQPAPEAGARISGSEANWIEALGPDADRGALEIKGDERLGAVVLDGICAGAARAARAA